MNMKDDRHYITRLICRKLEEWNTMGKKFLAIIVAMAVLGMVAFAGCGKNETNTANVPAQKVIKVGTSGDYPPYCFKQNDQLQGFEIDTWNEIGKRAGYKIEFKVGKFSGLFGMLDAGQIDTIAHVISTTPERTQKYDFTEPYAYSAYQFFVKKDSPLNILEDFRGKKIGAYLGGNGEKTIKEINEKYNMNIK